MLVAVLTPLGSAINGTKGWFTFGPISFQPVEAAKVALALWGAHILVVKRAVLHQYRHLLVPVVPAALVMFALVMLQPDLGGTITLGVVLIALLWFAGAPMRLFGGLALGALAGVVVLAVGTDYRLSRGLSWLPARARAVRDAGDHRDPDRHPQHRPVDPHGRRDPDRVAGGPGGDQHRVRRRVAAGHRYHVAADLLGWHLGCDHLAGVRNPRQLCAPRARSGVRTTLSGAWSVRPADAAAGARAVPAAEQAKTGAPG